MIKSHSSKSSGKDSKEALIYWFLGLKNEEVYCAAHMHMHTNRASDYSLHRGTEVWDT